MTQYRLVGKKEVYIGSERIPSECIADEIGTITVTPSTTEISSQAGTFNVPNGAYDELSATITVIIPSVRFLGRIFPNLWKAGKFKYEGHENDDDYTPGQVSFGANECRTTDPVTVVIHNACDTDSSQDIRIPNALIANGGEFDVNLTDPFEVELQISMIPGDVPAVIFGEGSLDEPTLYNPKTGQYEPIPVHPTDFTLTPANVSVATGSTVDVTIGVVPENATERTPSVTVDHSDIAAVSVTTDGKVRVSGTKAGTATATVTVGTIKKTLPITVTAAGK
jgi:uncharacterized protein YjdB